jgi:hypothetical protein
MDMGLEYFEGGFQRLGFSIPVVKCFDLTHEITNPCSLMFFWSPKFILEKNNNYKDGA